MVATFVKLSHDVICRYSNPLGKYSGERRFEVMDNKQFIDEGTYGEVYSIAATLALTNDSIICKIKPPGRQRVVKIQEAENKKQYGEIMREYQLSCMTNYLHPKEPIFSNNLAFFVMRRLEGSTLSRILEKDLSGKNVLTMLERINISIAILKALEEVHANHIIHLDIKPNNIIVNMKGEEVEAKIIDYGLSQTTYENMAIASIGGFPFIAPELRPALLNINSQKSDIYSISRVISEIFRVNALETALKNTEKFASKLWAEAETGFFLDGLFEGILDITPSAKRQIRMLLIGMGRYNPEKRWTLQDSIKEFESIKQHAYAKNETSVLSLYK